MRAFQSSSSTLAWSLTYPSGSGSGGLPTGTASTPHGASNSPIPNNAAAAFPAERPFIAPPGVPYSSTMADSRYRSPDRHDFRSSPLTAHRKPALGFPFVHPPNQRLQAGEIAAEQPRHLRRTRRNEAALEVESFDKGSDFALQIRLHLFQRGLRRGRRLISHDAQQPAQTGQEGRQREGEQDRDSFHRSRSFHKALAETKQIASQALFNLER